MKVGFLFIYFMTIFYKLTSINRKLFVITLLLTTYFLPLHATTSLGIDLFFKEDHSKALKDKSIGLIINHTSYNSDLDSTLSIFQKEAKDFHLKALFTPEHGLNGSTYAGKKNDDSEINSLPVYSLYGKNRRPSLEMIKDIDVFVFDIQEIGCRSYTYATTLFYVIEEAAKHNKEVIVLDRPNPINGILVDGPMLEEKWRSFIGYVNVPYCHGMTIGELASFFNTENKIGCKLTVIPMKGWKREMSFEETGLFWIPTSPFIPEKDSPLFYASTGIIGELGIVSIGIGYTLPFKVVGAPWIDADSFAKQLNNQNLKGIKFIPFHFRPFCNPYKEEECHGIKLIITDRSAYSPLTTQYMIMGILKTLYPEKISSLIQKVSPEKINNFCKVNGTSKVLEYFSSEKYIAWKILEIGKNEKAEFLKIRKKYLLY